MHAPKLRKGDLIGLVSPSHIAKRENYEVIKQNLISLGYAVAEGQNLYNTTAGYLASLPERAQDFNNMLHNKAVRLVFFGGGNAGAELLPCIDYDAIRKDPKLFLSYSDGTSILEAIHMQTGLVTYYGQAPTFFGSEINEKTIARFMARMSDQAQKKIVRETPWRVLHGGSCEGTLIGGYTLNFALLTNSPFWQIDKQKKYILFIEDHEKFSPLAMVSQYLSHIEQSGFMRQVSGVIFGHYSDAEQPFLDARLARMGEKYGIPVVHCDDFGHYGCNIIYPIGEHAELDTDAETLTIR